MSTYNTECCIKNGRCERERNAQSNYHEPVTPVCDDEALLRVVKKFNVEEKTYNNTKVKSLSANFLNLDQLLESGWSFARSKMIDAQSRNERMKKIGTGVGSNTGNVDEKKKILGFVSINANFFREVHQLQSFLQTAKEENINPPSSQALCVIDNAVDDYKEHALVLASDQIYKIDEKQGKQKFYPNKVVIKKIRMELRKEMWANMTCFNCHP